jgi:hypothetical protein
MLCFIFSAMDDGLLEDERGDEPGDDETREDEITGCAEVERGEDELTRVEDEPTVAPEAERMEPADSAKVERSVPDGGGGGRARQRRGGRARGEQAASDAEDEREEESASAGKMSARRKKRREA